MKIFPIIKRAAGAASSAPDVVYNETFELADGIAVGVRALRPSTLDASDDISTIRPRLVDDVSKDDAWVSVDGQVAYEQRVELSEGALRAVIGLPVDGVDLAAVLAEIRVALKDDHKFMDALQNIVAVLRDEYSADDTVRFQAFATSSGDTWVDQDNPNTAHGADATLLVRDEVVAVHGEAKAYLKWDLTGLPPADWAAVQRTGIIGFWEFQVWAHENAPAVGEAMPFEVKRNAADPFSEAGLDYNDGEPPGVVVTSGSRTVGNAPTFALADVDLTQAQADDVLGDWVYLRHRFNPPISNATIFTIRSRENATVAERPNLQFAARLL